MLGSSASVATPNIVLNTAVAESLNQFYHELKDTRPEDMEQAVHELLKRAIRKHKRVIFNGNGYSSQWVEEAQKRGLPNLTSTPECLPAFISPKSIALFTDHRIFTKEEILSRYEILLENYYNTICIEARTMAEMLTKDFLSAVSAYAGQIAKDVSTKTALLPELQVSGEKALVRKLTLSYDTVSSKTQELLALVSEVETFADMQNAADFCHRRILPKMEELRCAANEAEVLIPDSLLPYPTFDKLLFSV